MAMAEVDLLRINISLELRPLYLPTYHIPISFTRMTRQTLHTKLSAVPGYKNVALFIVNEAQRVVITRADVIPTMCERIRDSSVTGRHVYSDMVVSASAAGLHVIPSLQILCVSNEYRKFLPSF